MQKPPSPGKVEEGQCMPEKPNVYSDGSVNNPRGLRWKVGGAGIWWQSRHMGKHPLTEAEELHTHHQTCGEATSLWACFNDTQNSSIRCELGAAILGITPPIHAHVGIDYQGGSRLARRSSTTWKRSGAPS